MDKMLGAAGRHLTTSAGAVAGYEGMSSGDWKLALICAVVTMFGMYRSYLEKKGRAE